MPLGATMPPPETAVYQSVEEEVWMSTRSLPAEASIPEKHHDGGMPRLLPGPAPHLHLTASSGYVLGLHS